MDHSALVRALREVYRTGYLDGWCDRCTDHFDSIVSPEAEEMLSELAKDVLHGRMSPTTVREVTR